MGAGIPFTFHVVTHTKPVHRDNLEDGLFPTPPTSPADVELVMYCRRDMRSTSAPARRKGQLGGIRRASRPCGCRSTSRSALTRPSTRIRLSGRARCISKACSRSPLRRRYVLRVKVGMGNDLELEAPVHIDSGAGCPPPRLPGHQPHAVYPLPYGPPSMMRLPLAYWDGKDNEWDEEK
ncbi:hypothetical protein DFH07DRAFT_430099 [Mycena maculata]|uniref:Uncharacterized protein n=1 Tax=Mycena maculata TaxID=230809 RepID=A0AAD7JE09_9AGAR|nr:hypothetical protein DFH07DRAFT_430099 [Mycena maculata]